jgi:hypothetical protein
MAMAFLTRQVFIYIRGEKGEREREGGAVLFKQ